MLNVLILPPGHKVMRAAHACAPLAPDNLVVVGNEAGLAALPAEAKICRSPLASRGEACAALLATNWIDNADELLIVSGEALANVDPAELVGRFRQRQLAAGLATFPSDRPTRAYVRIDRSGYVVEASENTPISRLATAGFYWFAQGRDFVRAAEAMIRKDSNKQGLFQLCPALNELVLAQKRIGVLSIDVSSPYPT